VARRGNEIEESGIEEFVIGVEAKSRPANSVGIEQEKSARRGRLARSSPGAEERLAAPPLSRTCDRAVAAKSTRS
jgi:hypothetical protein